MTILYFLTQITCFNHNGMSLLSTNWVCFIVSVLPAALMEGTDILPNRKWATTQTSLLFSRKNSGKGVKLLRQMWTHSCGVRQSAAYGGGRSDVIKTTKSGRGRGAASANSSLANRTRVDGHLPPTPKGLRDAIIAPPQPRVIVSHIPPREQKKPKSRGLKPVQLDPSWKDGFKERNKQKKIYLQS